MQRQWAGANPNDHDHASDDGHSNSHSHDRRHRQRHAYNTQCPPKITIFPISNLCSATLGAGALSLPYAFSLTGLIPGIILILFSAYASIVSIDLIISSCCFTNLFKYEDVAVRLAGSRAGKALEASLLIFCFGTAVAYIMAVGDILDQGLRSISCLWGSSGDATDDSQESDSTLVAMYSRERIMILFWFLVMFPLSLQKNVESLEWASSLGVLSIIFLVMAAVIHSISHGEVIGHDHHNNETSVNTDEDLHATNMASLLWPDSFWDVVRAFPIIIFAFSCQVNVCAIFEELSPSPGINPSLKTMVLASKKNAMSSITRLGIALCTILYIFMGVFGYLDFTQGTSDNILTNYCIPVTHDPLMIAASIFVAVAVVVAYPFNILPARVTLKLIWDRMRQNRSCGIVSCLTRRMYWAGRNQRINTQWVEEEAEPTTKANSMTMNNVSSSSKQCNTEDLGLEQSNILAVQPLLLEDDPHLTHIPHMSLSSIPTEDEDEIMGFASITSPQSTSSTVEHFVLTLLLSGSALVVALLIPNISAVFGLMGGTASSIISFILPGMFLLQMEGETMDRSGGNGVLDGVVSEEEGEESYSWLLSTSSENPSMSPLLLQLSPMRGHSPRRKKLLLAWALILGGTLIGVLSTGVTLYGLFSKNNDEAMVDSCSTMSGSDSNIPSNSGHGDAA